MKHLLICREFPPAPGGGIGVYAFSISRLLAECGETVHVIAQQWQGAEKNIEEKYNGRLVIHRLPFEDWTVLNGTRPHALLKSDIKRSLFASDFHRQCFSWQASRLAERLVESEGIDIIEAQEYEAPLYYFQLRRALGLGPRRQPPWFVHLHSPTQFLAQYNNFDMAAPDTVMAMRLEAYSIQNANVVLCPSRFLAHQAEAVFGIENVNVIPLPMGDNPRIERTADTWKNGNICYVGRLERRKGVLEWIDAAVMIAHENPSVQFEFVGENVLGTPSFSGEELIERRIPKELRARFHFRGAQKRDEVSSFLAHARIAVVPSRWENFPNTCVEAMCSGLPVIASREGGMAEMIEDGCTGWLAESQDRMGLARALCRALETPPAQLAEMGRRATKQIHMLCDNRKIVERHMEFRTRLVKRGAGIAQLGEAASTQFAEATSTQLALTAPTQFAEAAPTQLAQTARMQLAEAAPTPPLSHSMGMEAQAARNHSALAIVVTCLDSGESLADCLASIDAQTRAPAVVLVVHGEVTERSALIALDHARRRGWMVLQRRNGNRVAMKNEAIEILFSSGLHPLGFAFLDSRERLGKNFVARVDDVLKRNGKIGIVSCWSRILNAQDEIRIEPCPSLPYQFLWNEAVSFSAVRTEALLAAGKFRAEMVDGYESWDLFNGVLAAGWSAVTVPEVLGAQSTRGDSLLYSSSAYSHAQMRRALLARFPEVVARDAQQLLLLRESEKEKKEIKRFSVKPTLVRVVRYPRTTGARVVKLVTEKTAARIQFGLSKAVARLSQTRSSHL